MGIFSAIEILFFFLGVLATLGLGAVVWLVRRGLIGRAGLALALGAVGLGLFTVAWSASCWIEGEPQAAGMGVVFFGIPAALCVVLARRFGALASAGAPTD